jgi:hypothetical protein
MTQSPPVPGAVLRSIVRPTPLYPWALIHPVHLRHPGLELIERAVREAIERWAWLEVPDDSWIPAHDLPAFEVDNSLQRPTIGGM